VEIRPIARAHSCQAHFELWFVPFVTSRHAQIRSILFFMGLDHVLLDFLVRTATGAASVLLVILIVGVSIPRRTPIVVRRTLR